MLLSLQEIQRKLLELYEQTEREISELNMSNSTLVEKDIEVTAKELEVVFPRAFVEVVLSYDFGNLNVGGVFFGYSGSYINFLKKYNEGIAPERWWARGKRPVGMLMVAATDSYVILMECQTGAIFAFLRGADWSVEGLIATSFEHLVRGAGTVYFGRKKAEDIAAYGREVGSLCGAGEGISFWSELAQGFA